MSYLGLADIEVISHQLNKDNINRTLDEIDYISSKLINNIKNNEKLVEKQDKREENYQKLLSDMTEKYAVVEDIRNSVDEIQKKMEQISIEQKE